MKEFSLVLEGLKTECVNSLRNVVVWISYFLSGLLLAFFACAYDFLATHLFIDDAKALDIVAGFLNPGLLLALTSVAYLQSALFRALPKSRFETSTAFKLDLRNAALAFISFYLGVCTFFYFVGTPEVLWSGLLTASAVVFSMMVLFVVGRSGEGDGRDEIYDAEIRSVSALGMLLFSFLFMIAAFTVSSPPPAVGGDIDKRDGLASVSSPKL